MYKNAGLFSAQEFALLNNFAQQSKLEDRQIFEQRQQTKPMGTFHQSEKAKTYANNNYYDKKNDFQPSYNPPKKVEEKKYPYQHNQPEYPKQYKEEKKIPTHPNNLKPLDQNNTYYYQPPGNKVSQTVYKSEVIKAPQAPQYPTYKEEVKWKTSAPEVSEKIIYTEQIKKIKPQNPQPPSSKPLSYTEQMKRLEQCQNIDVAENAKDLFILMEIIGAPVH